MLEFLKAQSWACLFSSCSTFFSVKLRGQAWIPLYKAVTWKFISVAQVFPLNARACIVLMYSPCWPQTHLNMNMTYEGQLILFPHQSCHLLSPNLTEPSSICSCSDLGVILSLKPNTQSVSSYDPAHMHPRLSISTASAGPDLSFLSRGS